MYPETIPACSIACKKHQTESSVVAVITDHKCSPTSNGAPARAATYYYKNNNRQTIVR